jgi:hypothetical protein
MATKRQDGVWYARGDAGAMRVEHRGTGATTSSRTSSTTLATSPCHCHHAQPHLTRWAAVSSWSHVPRDSAVAAQRSPGAPRRAPTTSFVVCPTPAGGREACAATPLHDWIVSRGHERPMNIASASSTREGLPLQSQQSLPCSHPVRGPQSPPSTPNKSQSLPNPRCLKSIVVADVLHSLSPPSAIDLDGRMLYSL